MSFEERTKTMLQHNNLYKKYTKKEMREILKSNLWVLIKDLNCSPV